MKLESSTFTSWVVKMGVVVDVFEFPSACRVLTNKLEKRKTNENVNMGCIYSSDKSMVEVAYIKTRIYIKKNVDNIITNPNIKHTTTLCKIEL